jgi:hypothetical protein
MPWFRHHYHCDACEGAWLGEAQGAVPSDCPFCGTRDVFAYKSDDRSIVIEEHRQLFVVLEAMKSAERRSEYRRLKAFPTRETADAFAAKRRTVN